MSLSSEEDSLDGRSWVEICEAGMAEKEALCGGQSTSNKILEEGELRNNSTIECLNDADFANATIKRGELRDSLTVGSTNDMTNASSIEEGEITDDSALGSVVNRNTSMKGNMFVSDDSNTTIKVLSYAKVVQGSRSTIAGSYNEDTTLNDDLSLTSHLDVFHVDSPTKDKETKKTSNEINLILDEDTVMFSPCKKEENATKNMKRPFMLIDSPVPKSRERTSSCSSFRKIAKCEIGSDVHSTTNDGVVMQSCDGIDVDMNVSSPSAKRELEVNPEILSRRQKQIDYGKNTQGYERYTKVIPKHKRTKDHPKTPPKHLKMSRRAWDGLVRNWRLKLHKWDPINENDECDFENANFDQFSFSSEEPSSYDSSSVKSDSTPSTPKQRTSVTESEDGGSCGDQWAHSKSAAVKSESSKELWSNCQQKSNKSDDDEFLGCEPLSENCVKACS